jgi:hypothetical protein
MPEPKTRKKKKNTAQQGVAPIEPTNENYLFPGIRSSVIEPRQISWPQVTSDPSDRGYLEPYDPFTGLPTGQAPIYPYIPQMQPYTMYGPPMPPGGGAATPTSAAPNVPPYVGGGQSGLVPWVNPATGRVEMPPAGDGYAKNLTTGNVPAGGYQGYSLDDRYRDYGWRNEYETPAYMWNEDGALSVNPSATGGAAEPVPGWTSVYSRDFYANQRRKPLVGITGGTNRRTMGTRDWRTKNRWENALEDKKEDENPAGNNNMKTIPAWVGPLVSWRT